MNLQSIQEIYQNDVRLKELSAGLSLSTPKLNAQLYGLKGSSISFVSAAVWHFTNSSKTHIGNNHVFVLNDREDAAYFHNDLERITKGLDIHYFPDSYKKEADFSSMNSSHVMLRTEALSKLTHDRSGVALVTYPEALFEKVIQAQSLKDKTIHIKVSQNLEVPALLERLVTLGFHKGDFVYEPGQFAMRGGILDIYSYGNEHPYRLELFGKEVDSIRIFNPETQLSERKLMYVSILPSIESKQQETHISIMDYLPENTVFWFVDKDLALAKLQQIQANLYEKIERGDRISLVEEEKDDDSKVYTMDDFESPQYFTDRLYDHHIIEWFPQSVEEAAIKAKQPSSASKEVQTVQIGFDTQHQPSFNREFDLLIADIKQLYAAKYEVFIFADNVRQLERLHSIFEEKSDGIQFVPIPIAISKGFIDKEKRIAVYTDHQIFQRFHKYQVKQSFTKGKALTIKALRELQSGDYVTHIDHGVGVYSGLQKIEVNGAIQEAVRIIYRDNDILYVNINALHKISKFTGKDGHKPKIHKLGSDTWEKLKNKTKRQVKDIAADLIKLYAQRKAAEGFAHAPDTYLQAELEASFIYEDTPDQTTATADVKKDMEAPHPMDRLVCGDVGFGKTEIAIRAAFKTVSDSKQAAILVPTTILAYQHFQSFSKRLKRFPCNVDYINRFKSAKEKKDTLQRLKEGKIDILIGTHAILSKDVVFKDLGLLIVDEEQKFGVAAKEKLRQKKINVDTLTLTATPIPRTLQFSLMSARDLSIMNTPPPNRQPVHTELIGFNEDFIREAIYYEAERGGQVYFVHNRVQSLQTIAAQLKTLCPDLEIRMAHGQMDGKLLEKTLVDFMDHKIDVLCCTNIVESGVDISNANTIFINNAHQFGLSDLHQLRGRVGRSNKKAFCYMVAPSLVTLPDESRKRLQTLEQFSDLGSGFQIAMRDLDIRGAGDMLGGEQSGFITDIGFEMYQKILAEAIKELKRSDFAELFSEELQAEKDYVQDCTIDTDLEIMIPDAYVENIGERLSLYTQLENTTDDAALLRFETELLDRFGPIPKPVQELLITVQCRRIAKELGFEKIILKNKKLRLYFINNPASPYFDSATFQEIMEYLQKRMNNAHLKQTGKHFYISIDNKNSMKEVYAILKGMERVLDKPQEDKL